MSAALKLIHVAKRELGLQDDDYRAILRRETGKESSKDMTAAEHRKVIEAMKQRGFKVRSRGGHKQLEGRYAPKLQALWISAWNLGLVRNRHDKALIAFVKRQTGIDHVRFVRDPEDANKAIEALKGWMTREGGVDWPTKTETAEIAAGTPGFTIQLHERHRVLWAIERRQRELGRKDANYITYCAKVLDLPAAHWLWTARELDDAIRLMGRNLRAMLAEAG